MTTFDASKLPSRTLPYSFKEITMSPFRMPQIMLASRAVSTESMAPMIEALDKVIDVDVRELTDGDFFYLLAYQRIVNYTSPLVARWTCDGIVFRENDGLSRTFTQQQMASLVAEYEQADEEARADLQDPNKLIVTADTCGHANLENIVFEDLKIAQLPEDLVLPLGIDFPRVSTLVDAIEMRKDVDMRNIVNAARWVAEGSTLAEKLEVLESQTDLALFERALQAQTTIAHGAARIISKLCTACGESSDHLLDISPETFFNV